MFIKKTKTTEQELTTEQAINLAIEQFNKDYVKAQRDLAEAQRKLQEAQGEVNRLDGLKTAFCSKLGKVEA